jgi:hypothetical protein
MLFCPSTIFKLCVVPLVDGINGIEFSVATIAKSLYDVIVWLGFALPPLDSDYAAFHLASSLMPTPTSRTNNHVYAVIIQL